MRKRKDSGKQLLDDCSGCRRFLTLVLFVFKREILTRFGASEAILPYAESYFTIYLLGTVFAAAFDRKNQFIICQGFARIGMISVALGAVTNIVLDQCLFLCLTWAWRGRAFATVLSQFGVGGLCPSFPARKSRASAA